MKTKLLTKESEWTFDLIDKAWPIITNLAKKYGWEGYTPQFEIVGSEQMLDAYSSTGLPVMYNHWSFGKDFLKSKEQYEAGKMGLAYELVINTNPSICYLLEDNTSMMMLLTMSHAAVGHSHFFKNNYLFKENTKADSIVDYLIYAKKYVSDCEEKYGKERVSLLLDCCHSLQEFGVDKYKRKYRSAAKEKERVKEVQEYKDKTYNVLLDKTIKKSKEKKVKEFQPEENLLYFLEKNSLCLKPWEREIVRIVRKIAQYFYPQRQTKLMNEGFASFVHHTLMTDLHKNGYIDDGFMLEFIHNHTDVCCPTHQNAFINPYSLGFAMFKDIQRICMEPTDEDKKWFPDIAGTDWVTTINHVVANYKDESFISQFLSPKLMRDFKMFSLMITKAIDKDELGRISAGNLLEITGIHDDSDYNYIRESLARQYNIINHTPVIEITSFSPVTRCLSVTHFSNDGTVLNDEEVMDTLARICRLWGFGVKFIMIGQKGEKTGFIDDLRDFYWDEDRQDLARQP